MSVWLWRTAERRVGIVGLFAAGKTVLLTSVVNHLEQHDPEQFRLGSLANPVTLRKFRPLPPRAGWPAFPFAASRDALVHQGRWPRKTFDRSEFACQFERSDWRFNDVRLRLLDLPGERLADAAMLGRDFAEWSDRWHGLANADATQQQTAAGFLAALARPDIGAAQLLASYRLALATAISAPHYRPFITPSVFLLDQAGGLARGATPEEVAGGRQLGVSPELQFCPLPANVRAMRPDLVIAFATAYAAYQQVIVSPTIEALRSCHSLIVLVDVLALLAGGVSVCNDHREILKDLFDVLDPGETFLAKVGRRVSEAVLQYRPPGITRVAFVCPKIDLVHPQDRDRVKHLLKRFVGKLASDRDNLVAEFFLCSAVRSTKALKADDPERTLVGVPYRDASGAKVPPGPEQRFASTAIPAEWPHTWRVGDYRFPEVYPSLPALKIVPPDQIGVDRVMSFVLE